MRALLIYPEIPDTFWSFKHALRLIRKKASSPPLGLLTVAGMLPDDWSLRLLDLNVTALTDADLAWADCALVSGMIVQRNSALRVVSRCKGAGLTVIAEVLTPWVLEVARQLFLGVERGKGVHASLSPERLVSRLLHGVVRDRLQILSRNALRQ